MTEESIAAVLRAYLEKEDLSIIRRSDRQFDLSEDEATLRDVAAVVIDASSVRMEFWAEEPTAEIPLQTQERLVESCR